MGIGLSIFLIAVGAILAFAVHFTVSGLDLSTVGVILMLVGGIGLAASLFIFGGRGLGARRTTVESYDSGLGGERVVRRDELI